jgi:peptide/nickel transport system substrate-binding protein
MLVASACGGSNPAPPTVNADPNGTFKFAATDSFDSLDPAKTKVTNTGIWFSPAYDTLITSHSDGTYTPGLATDWAYVDNNAGFQLHLRKGVTFHDGTTFNAQAAKANLDRNKAGSQANDMRPVTKVDVVDDSTIRLALAPESGGLITAALADSAGRMVSPAAFSNADLGRHPVGTGPFKWVSITPSAITYERNEGYWGKKPAYKTLVIGLFPASDINSRINAVTTGAWDATFLSNGLKLSQIEQYKAQGLKVDQEVPAVFQYVNFNRSTPPFDNMMVRQAIGYALDRESIAKALNFQATDEFTAPKSRYFVDKYKDYYTYDPAKAKKMLADAGYPNGFTTELANPSYQSEFGQAVQANLTAIGIKTTIHPLDSAPAIVALCFTGQKCPMFAGAAIEQNDPTRLAEQYYLPTSLQNMGKNVPPEVSKALTAAEAPTTDAEHLKRVQDLVIAQVLTAPNQIVGHVNAYVIYGTKISGLSVDWEFPGYPNYTTIVVSK